MKIKLLYILILFCLASPALVSSSFAQDAGMQDLDINESDKEKMLYSPGGEGENVYRSAPGSISTHSKDSVISLPPVQASKTKQSSKPADKPSTSSSKGDDDSILSFNFLYYIIQKYKLQDMVD